MKSRTDVKPYLAFSAICMIWGSTFLFIGLSNEVLPPMWALSMRLFFASILLTLVMVVRKMPFPRGAALRAAIGYGIFDFAANLALLYWAETKLASGLAAVIYGTAPIVSMMMEAAFGMEKIDLKRLAGGLVAMGGVALIFWREITSGQSALPILALLAAVVRHIWNHPSEARTAPVSARRERRRFRSRAPVRACVQLPRT